MGLALNLTLPGSAALPDRHRILLLNPPGRKRYLRDYFCSKVSQADYVHHPIDLLFLSGFLKQQFRLSLVDAIVQNLGPEACLDQIAKRRPDSIVGLVGSVSYPEDRFFYAQLSQKTSARLILVGDVLLEDRKKRLEKLPFVGALLHDFSTPDLRRYLTATTEHWDGLKNMTVRVGDSILALPLDRKPASWFQLPIPEHRLFLDLNYRYPFVRRRRFATVLTDFGCPYPCTFCVMSTLGWKQRPVDNVMQELRQLEDLQVQEIFFLDQTFGLSRSRTTQLLRRMREMSHRFGWVCFSRPDILEPDLLEQMKSAGCHTVILGLESGSQVILDSVKKGYQKKQIERAFRLCRKLKIRTVATVILGLPEETQETFLQTLDFIREVDPDFASFNVAVPRMGTPLRSEALQLGLIDPGIEVMDQSGSRVAMPSKALSREQIAALRERAFADFYFRPSSWPRRLSAWLHSGPSPEDLLIQARQASALLLKHLKHPEKPLPPDARLPRPSDRLPTFRERPSAS